MKPLIILAGVVCAGLIGLGAFFAIKANNDTTRILPLSASYTARTSKGYWSKGSDSPTVTLLEYGDFQCPACGAQYPVIEGALKQMPQVQFHFRSYPLTQHPLAAIAAKGAEAAGRQGKFWEMYDALYSNQQTWTNDTLSTFQNTTLTSLAQSVGLNVDQFKKDLKDSSLQAQVDSDMAAANLIPLTGTPTLQINGVTVTELPNSVETLVNLLKTAETATPTPTPAT
jgi:protein-disulfide isomerase